MGPTGTGKSSIVRRMCNKYPERVLYCEAVETKTFTTKLAKELNMKIAPSSILDIILAYFTTTYTLHYTLPVDQAEAFYIIIASLGNTVQYMVESQHYSLMVQI